MRPVLGTSAANAMRGAFLATVAVPLLVILVGLLRFGLRRTAANRYEEEYLNNRAKGEERSK